MGFALGVQRAGLVGGLIAWLAFVCVAVGGFTPAGAVRDFTGGAGIDRAGSEVFQLRLNHQGVLVVQGLNS